MAHALVAAVFQHFDQEEVGLDVFRAEAVILIVAARLLAVEVNVEQFARVNGLRDGMDEVQARHRIVREFGVDAELFRTCPGWR